MIVPDAPMLANIVGDDGDQGKTARAILAEARDAAIPDLANVECVAVLRKRWIAGTIDDQRFADAVNDLLALPIDRYPSATLLRRACELRHNVAVYDACYVALAEALGADVVTADGRLARASGLRCQVRLLP